MTTILTDEQIEKVAREYCRLLGVDPDEQICGADAKHPTLAVFQARWYFMIDRVKDHVAMKDAIIAVLGDDKTPTETPVEDSATNATFLAFRERGKYYTSHRGVITPALFAVFSREERLAWILSNYDNKFPGLSGPGNGYHRVVIADDTVDFGYPLMFPAKTFGL